VILLDEAFKANRNRLENKLINNYYN
jgi:hypothetical protein